MSYMVRGVPNKSKFPPIPAGSYGAICYGIIGVGGQYSKTYNKWSRKVILLWELPDEQIEIDGKLVPRGISKQYTESISERSELRKMLTGWIGRDFKPEELEGFDISRLLGSKCLLTTKVGTSSSGNEYADISGVGKLPKGFPMPEQPSNPLVIFNIDKGNPAALDEMKKLPEWIQERIRQSEEYIALTTVPEGLSEAPHEGFTAVELEGDLPF